MSRPLLSLTLAATFAAAQSLPASAQQSVDLASALSEDVVCNDQSGFPITAITDGDPETVWSVDRVISPCHAVFRFDAPVAVAAVVFHNRAVEGASDPAQRATLWASHQGFGRAFFRIADAELNADSTTRVAFEEPILMRTLKLAIETPDPFSSNWFYASLAEVSVETVAPETASRWPMPPLQPFADGDPISPDNATACDELAAVDFNPDSYGYGRSDADLDVEAAMAACTAAVANNPDSKRLSFHLARIEALAEQSVRAIARLGSPLLADYPPAMHDLAQALDSGRGIAEDNARHLALHTAAADAGYLLSRLRLAELDAAEARKTIAAGNQTSLATDELMAPDLEVLVAAGYVPAYNLHNAYLLRAEPGALRANMWRLEDLAEYDQTGPFSQYLYNDQHGIPAARRRAHRWIRELAQATQEPSALGDLSIAHRYLFSDIAASVPPARRGAYSGDGWPVRQLADRRGGEGAQQLYRFSHRRDLEAAEGGDFGSMFDVGKALIDGVGVDLDRAEGARWMRRAAAAGSPRAVTYVNQNAWTLAEDETDP